MFIWQPEKVVSSLIKVMDRSNAPAVNWNDPLALEPGFKEAQSTAPKSRTSPKATAEKLAILNSQLNQGFASLQTGQVESTRQIVEAIKSSPAPVSPFSNVNWTPILQGIANVVITSLGGKQVEFSTPTPAVQARGEVQGVANIAQIKELIKTEITPLIQKVNTLESALTTLVQNNTQLTSTV